LFVEKDWMKNFSGSLQKHFNNLFYLFIFFFELHKNKIFVRRAKDNGGPGSRKRWL